MFHYETIVCFKKQQKEELNQRSLLDISFQPVIKCKKSPKTMSWSFLIFIFLKNYIFDKSGISRVKAGIPVTSIPVINK